MHPEMTTEEEARFDQRIAYTQPGQCWLWTGSVDGSGYGKVYLGGRYVGAHRVALARALQLPLRVRGHVMHSCDTPRCCNPGHLTLGTAVQNVADRVAKGRNGPRMRAGPAWEIAHANDPRQGEHNGNARLTLQQVVEIRRRVSEGEQRAALAREFKVTWTTVQGIVTRRLWK